MALHAKNFREELYLEHLEEAAYLYETRCHWLIDSDVSWLDLEEIDARIEAHLDALIIGQHLALKVCLDCLPDADANTLHIIVRLYCRHKLVDRLSRLWQDFDFEDDEKIKAVGDALKWECPQDWFKSLLTTFSTTNTSLCAVFAPSLVYQVPVASHAILSVLPHANEKHQLQFLQCLAYSDKKHSAQIIRAVAPYVKNKALAGAAALCLMAMGEARTLGQCGQWISSSPLVFAVGGDKNQSLQLIDIAQRGLADADNLLALGLAGNVSALPILLSYLSHPDLAEDAAQALQLLTGASIYDENYIEEKVDEEDLFPHELEAYKNGELPKNIDGKPFGIETQKLSTDKHKWQQWLTENSHKFNVDNRYRFGELFSCRSLLAGLLDATMPFRLRELYYMELAIRYVIPVTFFADDLIYKQKQKLNAIHQWVAQSENMYVPGRWLFAGSLL